jgi:4-hydroxy-tetrahydrodipicolinate synthase
MLRKLVEYLICEQDVDALIPLGTTGEATSLSGKEKESVICTVIEHAARRVPVIVGTGTPNVEDTIFYTKLARKKGADAVMIVVPYYIRPNQQGIFEYYNIIAKSVDIPIFLYNIPIRCGVGIELDTLVRIAKIESVIGIKDCSNSLSYTEQMIMLIRNNVNKPFSILTGEDVHLCTMLALGGDGAVAATGHVLGKKIKEIMHWFQAREYTKALGIQESIYELQQILFSLPNPILIKHALKLAINTSPSVRLPLFDSANDEELKRLACMIDSAHCT